MLSGGQGADMSLPTWAIFYNKKEEVCCSFINCGWFYPEDKELLMQLQYPSGDWDELLMYGKKYTYKEVQALK